MPALYYDDTRELWLPNNVDLGVIDDWSLPAVSYDALIPQGLDAFLLDVDDNIGKTEHRAGGLSHLVVKAAFCGEGGEVINVGRSKGQRWPYTMTDYRKATAGKSMVLMLERLANELGHEFSPDELSALGELELETIAQNFIENQVKIAPNLVFLVRRLRNHGKKVAGVTTSHLKRVDPVFACSPVLDRLVPRELRFSASSLGLPHKPNPAVYLKAVEALGVDPSRCITTEDSASGAKAARAAGIPCIGNLTFTRKNQRAERARLLKEAGAFMIIDNYAQLLDPRFSLLPALLGEMNGTFIDANELEVAFA